MHDHQPNSMVMFEDSDSLLKGRMTEFFYFHKN